ncbi:MAG TPA: hypothetical protein VIE17_05875 [Methylophilaceae bacterium]|jgi:hypothetical protein
MSVEQHNAGIHPSPKRGEVSLAALYFGIYGAPVAWLSLEFISYALTPLICNGHPAASHAAAISSKLLLVAYVIAGIVTLAAGAAAVNSWLKTRHELEGSAHHILEVGEGRSRFLAISGLLTSAGFIIAFLFFSSTLLIAPVCR